MIYVFQNILFYLLFILMFFNKHKIILVLMNFEIYIINVQINNVITIHY